MRPWRHFPAVIGETLGHYRIVEKIGAGGMGEVYRAHDEHLDRDVALKVLPAGTLTDEAARKRFRKEALALSKLNHPNIATVHDFDSQEGVDFLAMELVPGETFSEKLKAGPLKEKETLRLGMQLAEGLAAAHAQGIVHRDLKPGNILITPEGFVKILDFGLAKLQPRTAEPAATRSLAETHPVAGTLPYMSPEQLQGEPLDGRTDIYAAGAVLYEMATGRRPFEEKLPTALVNDVIHKLPPPPGRLNPALSPKLEDIILKCLEKEPDNRYQSARELLVDLRNAGTRSAVAAAHRIAQPKPFGRRLGLGAAIAVVLLAGILAVLNTSRWRERLFSGSAHSRIESLAVLPLENFSHDPDQEYFADGMTEELIAELSQIRALRVISRTSVMQYKGAHKPLPEIARALNVDGVIEGSVLRSGDRVRITAQLIQAATDKHLWAKSYDGNLRDVLSLQTRVARNIADEVQVALTPQEQARLSSTRPVNPQANEEYLKGRYLLARAVTEKDISAAMEFFGRAISTDAHFALAYAGIADGYAALVDAYLPPQEVTPKAKAAAMKALELDESLAEAHNSLGNALILYDWDWAAAEREFNRAIELNPGFALAHEGKAWVYTSLGRRSEAAAEIRQSQQLDPLSAFLFADGAWLAYLGRQYDQAIIYGRKALEIAPNDSLAESYLGLAYVGQGNLAQAVAEAGAVKRSTDSPLVMLTAAYVFAVSGKREEAESLLHQVKKMAQQRYICPYEFGTVYLALGDKDEAFKSLRKGYEGRSVCMVWAKVDPRFDPVRSDPRYNELLKLIGFPQ